MKKILFVTFLFCQLLVGLPSHAGSIDLSVQHDEAIGRYIQFMPETNGAVTLDAAIKAFHEGQFKVSNTSFLSFGIGVNPVWLRFSVDNPFVASKLRRLSLKTSWLDKIEVYFLRDQLVISQYEVGDKFIHEQRPILSRFFEFDYDYPAGETTVYIRVVSDDPMVLPVYFNDLTTDAKNKTLETYSYGIIYGVLTALLFYNLLVSFTLKSKRYLYYSFYITFFILMNMSYTGHGFRWFWTDSIQWQQWSNPALMILYSLSGLLFATRFLQTNLLFPKLNKRILVTCFWVGNIELLLIIFNNQVGALYLAFAFVFVFTFLMLYLAIISLRKGFRSARYFLLASVSHVTLSSVTAMTVWGLIPYTTIGYRALEFGMMFDAIILSIALVDQFRILNEEKAHAEQLAMTDHLTGTNNRRAFYELVKPIWSIGLRKEREMCVMMIDIDKFKDINDRYGHSFGDEVLKKLSNTLLQNVREGDIFARWGGEEFILFLPETTLLEATEVAERYRELISSTELTMNEESITVTISVGVAQNIGSANDIDELIMEADKCLYVAKEQGRNKVSSRKL